MSAQARYLTKQPGGLFGSPRRYTRIVLLGKVLLWALATGLIIALITSGWLNSSEPGVRLVLSGQKNEQMEGTPVMQKPHYQGVDKRNRPFTIIAETATQPDADHVIMHTVSSDMMLDGESWVALTAGSSEMELKSKLLTLKDKVSLFYQDGYEFRTETALIDINAGSVKGDTSIFGQGPSGTLRADRFFLKNHGKIMHFNGSVKVVIYR